MDVDWVDILGAKPNQVRQRIGKADNVCASTNNNTNTTTTTRKPQICLAIVPGHIQDFHYGLIQVSECKLRM